MESNDIIVRKLTSYPEFTGKSLIRHRAVKDITLDIAFKTFIDGKHVTIFYQPNPSFIDASNRIVHPLLMDMKVRKLDSSLLYGITNITANPEAFNLDELLSTPSLVKSYTRTARLRHMYELIQLACFLWDQRQALYLYEGNIVYQNASPNDNILVIYHPSYGFTPNQRSECVRTLCTIVGRISGASHDIRPLIFAINTNNKSKLNKYKSVVSPEVLSLITIGLDSELGPYQMLEHPMFKDLPLISGEIRVNNPLPITPSNIPVFGEKLVALTYHIKNRIGKYSVELLFLMLHMFYRMSELVIVTDTMTVIEGLEDMIILMADDKSYWNVTEVRKSRIISQMEALNYVLFANPLFDQANDAGQLGTVYTYGLFDVGIYDKIDVTGWLNRIPRSTSHRDDKYMTIDEFFNGV